MNDRAHARTTRLRRLEADLERTRRRHARRSGAAPTRSEPRTEPSSSHRWTAAFDDGAPIVLTYDRAAQPATSRSGLLPAVHRALSFECPTDEPLRKVDPPAPVAVTPPAAPPATARVAPPADPSLPGRVSGSETVEGAPAVAPSSVRPVTTGKPSRPAGDDEEFAQDLLSILGVARTEGGTTDAATTSPQPAAPAPVTPKTPPAPAELPLGVGAAQSHDIFDRMGQQLAYANRFDVGPVALNHVFDAFDRTIDRDERARMTGRGGPADTSEQESLDEQFDVAEVRAAHGDGKVFRVVHQVDLVPQVPGLTCWAAAAAMLVAWRDGVRAEASQVVDGAGYWERFARGRAADRPPLDEWGVQFLDAGSYEPRAMRTLLETHGPLLVSGAPPGPHAVVVAGLTGDGSSEGTIVDVVDPWAPGMTAFAMPNPGSRASEPWSRFVARLAGEQVAGTAAPALTVGHLRPRETERSS